MLWVARSIRAESASGKVFRRNQRPPHDNGACAKRSVIAGRGLSTAQVAQDEFLQKTVEVYLEQTQVPARPNGRAKVIAQFAFGVVIFCRDDQTRLIERVQPGISMFGGNAQGTIRETFLDRKSTRLNSVTRSY